MRAHLVQLDIAWEEPERNFGRVADLLDSTTVSAGDLVLLPEMFDTGFSFNTAVTADTGRTIGFLTELARDLKVVVQGARTVQACHAARATNRATVIGPDGRLRAEYCKIHPFSFGGEPERFDGGTDIVTYGWGREATGRRGDGDAAAADLVVSPAICYDLRFPELFRLALLKGAEVFAIGANWPESRQSHWRALAIARAIENQAFVLAVNRTGRDPALAYAGGSIAVGPRGDILGELGPEQGVLSVEVNASELRAWRAKFPAWRDIRLLARSSTVETEGSARNSP